MSGKINFVKIFDKHHPDLRKFRIEAILECGGQPEDIELRGSYKSILLKLKDRTTCRAEDIYKLCDEKWLATEFDHIDAVYVDSDIACISGARIYKSWIRGAMFYFGLHKYRKQHSAALFKTDGNFERLLAYAKEQKLHGLFISIYPHEKRLKTLCQRLKEARSIPTEGRLDLIRSLKYRGAHTFNNVHQEFFAIEIDGAEFVPAEILG